jgi:M6 family metalloprotease-like protein
MLRKIYLSVILVLILSVGFVNSAPIKNLQISITQPNGQIVKCYVSGDEYFNYIHDSEGYLIVKDLNSGYYTYAVQEKDKFYPTEYIVGKDTPEGKGLPNKIDFSKIDIAKLREKFTDKSELNVTAPTTGLINNIVIFIRFSDENEFTTPLSVYDDMFNKEGNNVNSMREYFHEASYNQLTISTTFYPLSSGTVISYQDSHPRGYYQPSSISGSIGYSSDAEHTIREHTLLKNAIQYVASSIPTSLIIDGDNDGVVDNICFIVSGSPTGWSELLWPHKWSLYSYSVYINGKRVNEYNFQLQNDLANGGVSTLCHEMFHTLGAPDLYHYTENGIEPVGAWDLMANNATPPQHMAAYMKFKYGKWIPSIPTITEDGVYTLSSVSSPTNNIYKIPSPRSNYEAIYVEYRHAVSIFEASVPGEGLLIYRNDPRYPGNRNGPPDEVYIYRPGGTVNTNGSINLANFSQNTGRVAAGYGTNPELFLSNGKLSGITISEISAIGNTISFKVHIEKSILALAPYSNSSINVGEQTTITWDNFGTTTNYNIDYSTDNGITWQTIATNIPSNVFSYDWVVPNTPTFQAKIKISSATDSTVFDTTDDTFSIIPSGEFNVSLSTSYKVSGFSNGVTVYNGKAYVASKSAGLHILDISYPDTLIYLGNYNSDGSALHTCIKDTIAYLSDDTKGLKILSVYEPSNIKLLSKISETGKVIFSKVVGSDLYIVNANTGINIYDISNPYVPVLKSSIQITGTTKYFELIDNKLYVLTETNFAIYEISNNLTATLLGSTAIEGVGSTFQIKDNYAYIAAKTAGLLIVDISNVTSPQIVFQNNSFGSASDIKIKGEYAVTANESKGIGIYSIKNPVSPTAAGCFQSSVNAVSIDLQDTKIYIAALTSGLVVLESELLTKIEDKDFVLIPSKVELYQNYPNPFNPSTKIKFYLPTAGNCSIKIFNVLGELINMFTYSDIAAGTYELNFDGSRLSSGVYLYSLEFNNTMVTKKMMIIK